MRNGPRFSTSMPGLRRVGTLGADLSPLSTGRVLGVGERGRQTFCGADFWVSVLPQQRLALAFLLHRALV